MRSEHYIVEDYEYIVQLPLITLKSIGGYASVIGLNSQIVTLRKKLGAVPIWVISFPA